MTANGHKPFVLLKLEVWDFGDPVVPCYAALNAPGDLLALSPCQTRLVEAV